MKKFFSFVAAALMSASMFAALPDGVVVPDDATLNGYKADGANVVVAFYTTAEICNDVVFTGSVNNWSTDPTACPKFEAVDGFEGWYVTSFADASADIQGKPMHAKGDGTLSWDYQCGDDVELLRGTLTIEPGYNDEVNLKAYGTDAPVVYWFSKWKAGNNPCVAAVKHTYHVILDAPLCGGFAPAIIGDFNGWAEGVTMTGREDFRYEYTFEDEENHGFKFKAVGDTDWTNQIQAYNAEEDTWNDLGNEKLTDVETIEIDYSDPAKYRYTLCGEATPVENVAATVKAEKMIENGQLILIREGKRFNVLGAQF